MSQRMEHEMSPGSFAQYEMPPQRQDYYNERTWSGKLHDRGNTMHIFARVMKILFSVLSFVLWIFATVIIDDGVVAANASGSLVRSTAQFLLPVVWGICTIFILLSNILVWLWRRRRP